MPTSHVCKHSSNQNSLINYEKKIPDKKSDRETHREENGEPKSAETASQLKLLLFCLIVFSCEKAV